MSPDVPDVPCPVPRSLTSVTSCRPISLVCRTRLPWSPSCPVPSFAALMPLPSLLLLLRRRRRLLLLLAAACKSNFNACGIILRDKSNPSRTQHLLSSSSRSASFKSLEPRVCVHIWFSQCKTVTAVHALFVLRHYATHFNSISIHGPPLST